MDYQLYVSLFIEKKLFLFLDLNDSCPKLPFYFGCMCGLAVLAGLLTFIESAFLEDESSNFIWEMFQNYFYPKKNEDVFGIVVATSKAVLGKIFKCCLQW